jgi:hypothetical protein
MKARSAAVVIVLGLGMLAFFGGLGLYAYQQRLRRFRPTSKPAYAAR